MRHTSACAAAKTKSSIRSSLSRSSASPAGVLAVSLSRGERQIFNLPQSETPGQWRDPGRSEERSTYGHRAIRYGQGWTGPFREGKRSAIMAMSEPGERKPMPDRPESAPFPNMDRLTEIFNVDFASQMNIWRSCVVCNATVLRNSWRTPSATAARSASCSSPSRLSWIRATISLPISVGKSRAAGRRGGKRRDALDLLRGSFRCAAGMDGVSAR